MNATTETTRIRGRLRELEDLRSKVTAEINNLTDRLCDLSGSPRRRFHRPPCGTPQGYQWHRYNEPDRWPLPKHDPCGCRAAHAKQRRIKEQLKREDQPDPRTKEVPQ